MSQLVSVICISIIRPLYGLTDASRKWYCRMDKELTKLGGTRSIYDHAVYNFWKDGQLIGEVLLHVDDLLYGGSDFFHRKVMDAFTNMFTVLFMCRPKLLSNGLNSDNMEGRHSVYAERTHGLKFFIL